MGRKNKTANRTKNNARPSSSGRSAELLGFGFSGIKERGFGFSLSTFSDELDTSIDPTIQVILKKITKKDATTKIKGLQELADLIKNSEDQEKLKMILPIWPRHYNILVTDIDNRVREAAHIVLHQLVLKAKRNIAPYLKQLMAPWFTSQYDTYPPAASVATQAFKDTFSAAKFEEAIIFCQEDILSYISDNLLVQTAQTLSNSKNASLEEAEAKYERVLIACLQGYCLYLEKIPIESIKNAVELNCNIVSNTKFWKLPKQRVANVKAAWFKVLSVLLQKAPFLLEERAAQVTSTVFGSIDETDPLIVPHVWETVLLTMSTIKEWWTYINTEKVLFSKLWKILKLGGLGNTSVIYPSILPLISHLPLTVEENALQFYNTLFENFRIGLRQKSSTLSRSEYATISTAFVECLQYVILKRENDSHLCKTIIKNHLISAIEWCLLEDQSGYKIFFNQLASLVQCWGRYTKSEAMQVYMKFFFENIMDLFKDTLFNLKESKSYNMNSIANKQIEFLQSLKHGTKSRKQCKVKFSEEEVADVEVPNHQGSVVESDDAYFKELNSLVYNVCQEYVEHIQQNHSKELLEHVCSLLIDFDTKKFFDKLHEKFKEIDPDAKLVDIYDKFLYKWLQTELKCKHIVNLTFLLFKHLNSEEKQHVLDSLTQIPDSNCLAWCITVALAHPYNSDPLLKKWLKNDKVSEFFVMITDKEINDACPPELDVLFRLALTENEDGELFISKTTILQVIEKLTESIDNHQDHQTALDTCASLSAYISTIIYTENQLLTYSDKLLLALFRLTCSSLQNEEIISTETLYEVSTAWQDSLSLLIKHLKREDTITLASKLADILDAEFMKGELEEGHVNYLVNVVVNVMKAVYRSVPIWLTDFCDLFLERKLLKTWKQTLCDLCAIGEYVTGCLSSPFQEVPGVDYVEKLQELHVAKLFAWTYLKLQVAAANLEEEDDGEYEDDDEEDKDETNYFSILDHNVEFLAVTLHEVTLGISYLETFKRTKHYETVLNYCVLAETKLKLIIQNMSTDLQTALRTVMRDRCLSEAWLWCKAAFTLYSDVTPLPLADVYSEFTKNVEDHNLGMIHLTQVFAKHLSYDHIAHNKLNTVEDVIILRSLIGCDEIDVQIAEALTKVQRKGENLWRCDQENLPWTEFQEILEVVRLFGSLMEMKIDVIGPKYWDSAVISLSAWSTACMTSQTRFKQIQYQAFFSSVVKLFLNTDYQVNEGKAQSISNNCKAEWDDVLLQGIHGSLTKLWLYLADQFDQTEGTLLPYIPFIQEYAEVSRRISRKLLFQPYAELSWKAFLVPGCSLLSHRLPDLQLWGHRMLLALVPGLIEIDTRAVNKDMPHEDGLVFEHFKTKLTEVHDIVNSLLMEFKLCEDTCTVKSGTDSFTYTFGYLLLWDILLMLCGEACTELRYQYAEWLRNGDMLKNFLNNVFKLMPAEVLHCSEGKSKLYVDYFLRKPNMDDVTIDHLVCWLYSSAVTQLPALVRQWWTSLETKAAQVVEKVTMLYVSQHLCMQELNDCIKNQSRFRNMMIKVMPTAREIISVYTIDEAQVELVISLPTNYPLGGLDVQCNKQIGGTNHKQWLLQFKKCVLHQNGRIWDGLALWNSNLDRKFDGVEECYICFAVLHPGTYQMPKLSCETCKKKFHSACLYKWFRTSCKSTCPICRNLF